MPTCSPWSLRSLPLRGMPPPYLSKYTFYASSYPDTELGVVLLRMHCCLFMGTCPASLQHASSPGKVSQFLAQLSPRHHNLLITPNNSSLPAALVITKTATLQRATQIPIRSTLCHHVPQSWRSRLLQPIQATLVMMEQPQGKLVAHSASLQLREKPARPHSSSVFLPSSFSRPIIFQTGFPREYGVSCDWTLCAYGNMTWIIYHSQCILFPLTKGIWVYICIRGDREVFIYQMCLCINICYLPVTEQAIRFNTPMSLLKLVPWLRRTFSPFTSYWHSTYSLG